MRVNLHDGRQAEWDTDGTIGLEAQVMQDGDLVGFVPKIDGSEDFDEAQTVDAIARTDYDRPVATERAVAPPPEPGTAPRGRPVPPVPRRLPGAVTPHPPSEATATPTAAMIMGIRPIHRRRHRDHGHFLAYEAQKCP